MRAAASLGRWLAPLSFTDWSAARVTAALTERTVSWGTEHGWRVRREVPSLAGIPGPNPDRPGYLDVVCQRLDGPPIAVEIDRTDKRWSASKLLCEAEAGVVVVWLRWNSETRAVPPPLALVNLETTRQRIAGRTLYSLQAAQIVPTLAATAPRPRQPINQDLPCGATTAKGKPCPMPARPSGLCHVHDPAVQCGAINRKGRRCSIATGGGRCKTHQHVNGHGPGLFPAV